ncbi:MAG TPA: hypothetical protein VN181_00925, partial [Thermoanaerobaculia bacterium]|nr:hypothetical protein [Thermoanaerobaculia bacterium]
VFPTPSERRASERRESTPSTLLPRLSRSAYEKVFLKLASGKRVRVDDELLTPVAVKGWYHSVLRAPNGEERLLSIDDLVDAKWTL